MESNLSPDLGSGPRLHQTMRFLGHTSAASPQHGSGVTASVCTNAAWGAMSGGGGHIGRLDYHPRHPQLQDEEATESSGRPSDEFGHDGRFFEHVAEGILERDRARMRREVIRYGSFVIAIINW